MKLFFDNNLCEEVVEAELNERVRSGRPGLSAAFRKEADSIYSEYPPHKRSAPFHVLYQRFFGSLGYRNRIETLLRDMESAAGPLSIPCWFSKTLTAEEEGAQLNEDRTRLAFRVRPESLRNAGRLAYLLRHERLHIHDLLDPAFGHDAARPLSGASLAAEDLLRDRYRTLWDLSVDGRLERLGWLPKGVRERRAAEFRALFRRLGEERAGRVFEALWSGPRPSDADLRRMIQSAEELCDTVGVSGSGEGGDERGDPAPGGPCPLCRFPTYEWAALTEPLARRVRAEFPEWRPWQGLCSQCANRYLLATLQVPAAGPLPGQEDPWIPGLSSIHSEGGW